MAIALLLVGMSTAWAYEGKGTAASPYLIKTVDDLKQLATEVREGTNYAGKCFKLTTDLDLENAEWLPIGGNGETKFGGIFDGDGHVISNFKISTTTGNSIGFFGAIDNNSCIKNLGIKNGNVTSNMQNVGVLVGVANAQSPTSVYLENCYVINSNLEMNGSSGRFGILIGRTWNGTTRNCFVANSTLTVKDGIQAHNAGLVIGGSAGGQGTVFQNCFSVGCTITAEESQIPTTGAFLGLQHNINHKVTMENCYAQQIDGFAFTGTLNSAQVYKKGTETLTVAALTDLKGKLYLNAIAFTDEIVVTALNTNKVNDVTWKQGSKYPIFSTMADPELADPVSIASTNATECLQIISVANGIQIIAAEAQVVNLYGIDGRLVKTAKVTEGDSVITGLTKGIYIINQQKVIVK